MPMTRSKLLDSGNRNPSVGGINGKRIKGVETPFRLFPWKRLCILKILRVFSLDDNLHIR